VLLGFIPFALVLGAQAVQKGLGIWEVPLMTGLNFAGGSNSPPCAFGPRHRTCC
jgi:predicted branched-subunit amino acid permease